MRVRCGCNRRAGGAVNDRIGELLVKENLLTKEQLRDARTNAKGTGDRLGAQITKLGLLEESKLTDFVSKQYGVPVDQPRGVRDRSAR